MSVDTINYGEGRKLQAGDVETDQVPLGADTYYPGMELEFIGAEYVALVTDANIAGYYNAEERTLAVSGFGNCIMGGAIGEGGIVTDANVAKVLTEAQRATRRNRGFFIKRV